MMHPEARFLQYALDRAGTLSASGRDLLEEPFQRNGHSFDFACEFAEPFHGALATGSRYASSNPKAQINDSCILLVAIAVGGP